jgi:uncharacterized protein YbaR (Trm112 family)
MSAIAQKEQLIGEVARLRRAEQNPSSARENIASVRAGLERMAGPTVTRAMAARLLGVSQTALDRWVAAGDVPVLVTPTGRHELPLRWLVELVEAVRERSLASPDDRHPLGSVLRTRRSEAQRLDTSRLVGTYDRGDRDEPHRRAELLSLAYHRAIAQRLDDCIVRDAQDRLSRWLSQARIDPCYAKQWQTILANPPAEIEEAIGADTPHMNDLRQSSPFAGALSEPLRRRALALIDEIPV